MFASCPKNPNHKRFITTAHVVENWIVDETGGFIDNLGSIETAQDPDPGNLWACADCADNNTDTTATVTTGPAPQRTCDECGNAFDDNNGTTCKTCEDWKVTS